jgi:hypothetical protein
VLALLTLAAGKHRKQLIAAAWPSLIDLKTDNVTQNLYNLLQHSDIPNVTHALFGCLSYGP